MASVRYCTPEWLEESARVYRSSPEIQNELRKLTTKISFRIQAEPAWGIEQDIYFGAVVEAGELRELSFQSPEAAKQTALYIMGATAPEWKRVLRKESKVITELMLRKIILEKGSMASALSLMPYAPAFIDALTKAELRFPDEMASEELEQYKSYVKEFRSKLKV
jgi:hypothetical protein